MSTTAAELLVKVGWDDSAVDKGGKEAEGKVSNWAGALKGAALGVGVAVGGALVSGLMTAMDTEAANDKMAARLALPPDLAADMGKASGELYRNAWGESVADINDVMASAWQGGLIPEDATVEEMERVTSRVMDVATTFDQDFASVVRGAGNLVRNGLAADNEEAFDIITRGFQQGADKAEDYMDTLNEYSVQFQKLGIDGATATGLLSQGLQAGARDGDKVADAFKEFSIRAIDGSTLTAESFQALGLDAQEMTQTFARGGPEARAGLDLVMDRLKAMEDPALKAQVAVGLFGTQSEDLGQALYALDLDSAARGLGTIEGAAQKMSDTLNNNTKTTIEAFKRKALGEIADLVTNYVIPALQKFGGWVQRIADIFKNQGWQAAAQEVFSNIGGVFERLGSWLQSTALPAIGSALKALGLAFGAWVTETALPYLRENLPIWLAAFGEWITGTALPWLGEQTLALALKLGSWIIEASAFLIEHLPGWIQTFADWYYGTALPWVGEQMLGIAKKLGEWVGDAAVYLKDNLPKWIGAFVEWVVGTAIPKMIIETAKFSVKMWEWIADAVVALPGKLLNWIISFNVWAATEAMPALLSFGKNILGWLGDAVLGANDFLWDTGVQIVNGLIDGIWSMAGKLKSEVTAFINDNIPGPVRDLLGIFSPSRVFIEIGKNVVQGLAVGLTGADSTMLAHQASARMISDFFHNIPLMHNPGTPMVNNIGAPTAVQNATFNVEVVMPPGSNGDDIVRQLMKYQRQNGSLPFTVRKVAA